MKIPWYILKSLNRFPPYTFSSERPLGIQFKNIQYVFYVVYNNKLGYFVWSGGIRKNQNPPHWIYL